MAAQTMTAEPTAVVNGINVDDLFALIDDVKRDPAKGKTNWHVTTTWQGQARSRAEIEQTVRKLQELSIEWRKERAGRNFNRFRPNWPSDAT